MQRFLQMFYTEGRTFPLLYRIVRKPPKKSKKLLTISPPCAILIKSANEYGGIPERPKGADCKSVVHDFAGSNPASPTRKSTCIRKCIFLFYSSVCGGGGTGFLQVSPR